jgi:hypothetical protein
MKDWQRIALVALIVIGFWWIFVKKSGYSLCNLAEYSSDVQGVVPPGMIESVADVSVSSQTVASTSVAMAPPMMMGASGYRPKGGCGCGK